MLDNGSARPPKQAPDIAPCPPAGFSRLGDCPAGTLAQFHIRNPSGQDQAYAAEMGALIEYYGRSTGTPPLFVSYYTRTAPYIERVKRLRATLDKWSLPHRIESLPDQGSWVANTCLKAGVMQRAWAESDRPICWIDADAALLRAPGFLSDASFDMACVRRFGWYDLSGTVYFGKSPVAGRVIDLWTRLCEQNPLVWDQVLLTLAWYQVAQDHPMKTLWMHDDLFRFPQSLWRDLRDGLIHAPLGRRIRPVFDQTQASRAVKAHPDYVAAPERTSDDIGPNFRAALQRLEFSFDADIRTIFT